MINTKEIERRVFLTYHKDGIIDIYLGLSIVTLSIVMLSTLLEGTEASMMWGGMTGTFALFPIFYRESKKRYTFPRLGYVKFSEKKGRSRNSIMMLLGLGTLSALMGLWAFFLGSKGDVLWIETIIAHWHWFLASLFLGLFLLFGYITDLKRLYYYGLGSFVLFASGNFVPVKGFWLVLALGGAMMTTGLILLQRFKREYPLESSTKDE
jgi:hypothetical protein